ncbi:MAG: hypothetical protein ACYS76_14625 [Planctomycetota bacterium]
MGKHVRALRTTGTGGFAYLLFKIGGVERWTAGACDWADGGEDRATWWAAFLGR